MAYYKETPQVPARTVHLDIAPAPLHDLLSVLMRQWGIEPLLPGEDTLELHVAANSDQLLLYPSGGNEEKLPLPCTIEALWQALQNHLFIPPRRHFRVPIRLRGVLHLGTDQDEFISVSLSDAGLRFEFVRELLKGEEVRLELPLAEHRIELDSRVIYCIPTHTGSTIIGVIFNRLKPDVTELLREFLVESALRKVRRQMDRHTFETALRYLDLSAASRARLAIEDPA